ncbi:hypothetical protein WJX84_006483 [Apatococcus fuscideae]|uniref:Uncharacterized protein n=1 Tax=Apatococcus fuscideae TaxID=2026836 RepID=A0AAW1SZJ1_9CHLO
MLRLRVATWRPNHNRPANFQERATGYSGIWMMAAHGCLAERMIGIEVHRSPAEISMRMPHHGPELPSILDLEEGASKYVARRSILLWAPDGSGLVVKGWDSPPIVLSVVGVLQGHLMIAAGPWGAIASQVIPTESA